MGRLSDQAASDMLNTEFRGVASTAPATYYVALSTTEPADDGTNVTEPSGNGYARVAVTKNTTNWTDPTTSRALSNAVAITFPTPTGSWGTVLYVALYTASSGGTFRGWGRLADGVTVDTSTAGPVIPVGGLIINAPGS